MRLRSFFLVVLALASLARAGDASPALPPLSGLVDTSAGISPISRVAPSAHAVALPIGTDPPVVGANVNVIGSADAVEQRADATCHRGKQTAQNETTIGVDPEDPLTLVGGANDYRLYSATHHRYDAAGGFYRSTDGGHTWTTGLLPGLVRTNAAAPGPYEAAGDPAISAGPAHTFWYANIAFDRDQSRSSVAVSRSTDGGATWVTRFVVQSKDGTFHDKEWIAADPQDPNVAYVTWTRFATTADIMISKTTDGGTTWTPPRIVMPGLHQGSIPLVDDLGLVHIVYAAGTTAVAHAISADGGTTFVTQIVGAMIPWAQGTPAFRTPSLPAAAVDGTNVHIVYPSWNGSTNEIMYVRSPDYGATWLAPVQLSFVVGDQFFPTVGARNGRVFAGWFDRATKSNVVSYAGAGSLDDGLTWSAQTAFSSATWDVTRGNRFAPPLCDFFFGDYSGIAVGSDGVAHPFWTDARDGNSPGDPGTTADQDPFTASVQFDLRPITPRGRP